MEILTNNQPRDVLNAWELPERVLQQEFDYIPEGEGSFFKYRGQYYDLGEFFPIPDSMNREAEFLGWDGYQSDSYFSGVVVRYVDDCERVVVGTYVT